MKNGVYYLMLQYYACPPRIRCACAARETLSMYRHFFKRFFDIVLSLLVLVILSPVFLITAIAIKIDSKGPVLFKQERLGKGGRVFKIYKFRSMYVNAEAKLESLWLRTKWMALFLRLRMTPVLPV